MIFFLKDRGFFPDNEFRQVDKRCIDNRNDDFEDICGNDYSEKHLHLVHACKSSKTEGQCVDQLGSPGRSVVSQPEMPGQFVLQPAEDQHVDILGYEVGKH